MSAIYCVVCPTTGPEPYNEATHGDRCLWHVGHQTQNDLAERRARLSGEQAARSSIKDGRAYVPGPLWQPQAAAWMEAYVVAGGRVIAATQEQLNADRLARAEATGKTHARAAGIKAAAAFRRDGKTRTPGASWARWADAWRDGYTLAGGAIAVPATPKPLKGLDELETIALAVIRTEVGGVWWEELVAEGMALVARLKALGTRTGATVSAVPLINAARIRTAERLPDARLPEISNSIGPWVGRVLIAGWPDIFAGYVLVHGPDRSLYVPTPGVPFVAPPLALITTHLDPADPRRVLTHPAPFTRQPGEVATRPAYEIEMSSSDELNDYLNATTKPGWYEHLTAVLEAAR